MTGKTFKLSIKLKDVETVLESGFEPGVVATKVITYRDLPNRVTNPENSFNNFALAQALLDEQLKFLNETVEVVMEEQENDD